MRHSSSAFRYHGPQPQNLEEAIFGHSLKPYGWVYLVVAAVLIVSGFFVLSGSQVARWAGIVAGAIGAISTIGIDGIAMALGTRATRPLDG